MQTILTDLGLTGWSGISDGSDITVECLAGGGGGSALTSTYRGGGGGGYASKTVAYTSGSTIPIQIGIGGHGPDLLPPGLSADGGNTVWDTDEIVAYGGAGGDNGGLGGGIAGSGVTGSVGGHGAAAGYTGQDGGGGGGGAAGPYGNGGNGGLHYHAGGGGGGADGGTIGADADDPDGGDGGDNRLGLGHGLGGESGIAPTAGTNGGGGGGEQNDTTVASGSNGGAGTEWDATHGCGGGGGGRSEEGFNGGNGGLYGGGGGGGEANINKNNGAQGLMVITWTPLAVPAGLTYSQNPAVYYLNETITPNYPSSTGGVITSYSIDVSLPSGLDFNTTTGVITGTPTVTTGIVIYTVTAHNAAGDTSVALSITVKVRPGKSLHYAIEIYTDQGDPDHTPVDLTDATLGIVDGVFRFVSDRPGYDGSTNIPVYATDEIDIYGNEQVGPVSYVFYEGFFQKEGITSLPSTEVDISKGGGIATLSGFEFVLSSSLFEFENFDLLSDDYKLAFLGRKVRFSIFLDDVMYARWQGVIINNPYDEVDYHFSCGPDLSAHNMIPPKVINEQTFPNVGIGSQQTSQITISGAVSPESNLPGNIDQNSSPIPVCIGDIAYAELFNVDGTPQFEKIAISPRDVTPVSFYDATCAVNTDVADSTHGTVVMGPLNKYDYFGIVDWNYTVFLVAEDLGIAYPPGYEAIPEPFTYPGASNLAFEDDHFKDYFLFKQGDTKGIRIDHSLSHVITYQNPTSGYRYLYITILVIKESPEDLSLTDSVLLAPGGGWTATDTVALEASPIITSKIKADTTIFFQICKNIIRQIVSNFPVLRYNSLMINGKTIQNGLPVLKSFLSNLKVYENNHNLVEKSIATQLEINNNITEATTKGIPPVDFPHLQLKANSSIQENGISLLSPIILPAEAIKSIDYSLLQDFDNKIFAQKDAAGNYIKTNLFTNEPSTLNEFKKLVDRNRDKTGSEIFPDIILADNGVGSGCQVRVHTLGRYPNYLTAINSTPIDGGTGYVVNQVIEVGPGPGSGSGGSARITAVNLVNGAVTSLQVTPVTIGSGYSDDSTYDTTASSLKYGYLVTTTIDMTTLVDTDVDKAFFGMDFIATTPVGGVSGTSVNHLSFAIQFRLFDQYNRTIDLGIAADDGLEDSMQNLRDPSGVLIVHTLYQQNNPGSATPINNFLPKDFYIGGGNDNDETDRFFLSSYNEGGNGNAFAEIDLKKILTLIKNRISQPNLLVDIAFIGETLTGSPPSYNLPIDEITKITPVDLNLKIKQIGFVAQKTISTANKALYTEVQGETVGNDGVTHTNTIDTAIRHILEDYDNIPTTLVDYSNLSSTIGLDSNIPWYSGRQLLDRRNSIDYLQEMCDQSFVVYFMSKKGKHTFKFLDYIAPVDTLNNVTQPYFDGSKIVRDTIQNWNKTDISSVYNDFIFSYNKNPGFNKLDKCIVVTHIDDQDPGVTVEFDGSYYRGRGAKPVSPSIDDCYLATASTVCADWPIAGNYYQWSGSAWIDAVPQHHPGDGFPLINCIDADGIELWKKYCSFPGIPKTPVEWDPTITLPQNPQLGDHYLATGTGNGWIIDNYYVWQNGGTGGMVGTLPFGSIAIDDTISAIVEQNLFRDISGSTPSSTTGRGYQVGDILGIPGSNDQATVEVESVDYNGSILSVSLLSNGSGYAVDLRSLNNINSNFNALWLANETGNFDTPMCLDLSGNLWLGLRTSSVFGSLIKCSIPAISESWSTYTQTNSNFPDMCQIIDMVSDASGNIWMSTFVVPAGDILLLKFDGVSTFTPFSALDLNLSDPANYILKTVCVSNTLWGATWTEGVLKVSGGVVTNFNTTNSDINSDTCYCIAKDLTGNIYAGTNLGLSKYDGANWTNYTPANSSLAYAKVSIIYVDFENKLWVYSESADNINRSIQVFDGSWQDISLPNGPTYAIDGEKAVVLSITDDTSDIFISTNGGLYTVPVGQYDLYNKINNGVFSKIMLNSSPTFLYAINSNCVPIIINTDGTEESLNNYVYTNNITNTGRWVISTYANDYDYAFEMWKKSNFSWKQSFIIQQQKLNLDWFNDRSIFSDPLIYTVGVGKESTSFLYASKAVEWVTQQKEMVSFSVPINFENMDLELMDTYQLKDDFYAPQESFTLNNCGWITKIETDVINGVFNLTMTMQPATISNTNIVDADYVINK